MGRAWAALAMLAAAAIAPAARAEDADPDPDKDAPSWHKSGGDIPAIGMELYGSGMMAAMNGYNLVGGDGAPDALNGKNLNLRGAGWLAGGGLRVTLQAPFGLRGGVGFGLMQLGGMSLLHDDLASGVSIDFADKPMAVELELFVGKAFDAKYLFPYVDLKTSFDLVMARVATSIAGYGFVGNSDYHVWSATVAPRVGAFIPINDMMFVDLAAQYGLTGMQRAGFSVGFGVWSGG